ncbi:hypothetical protein [Streptomyces cellulosae]|uniref:hypothetical protein n=1 Tax=Streptomyces cellulosae TaxID=1968 RepID=UPI0004C58647|nr:hypothetical protein [Streptomyces cellulosae]
MQRYRHKLVSPVEVVRAILDRIEAVGDEVNAFTGRAFDEALIQAKQTESRGRLRQFRRARIRWGVSFPLTAPPSRGGTG